MPNVSDLNLTPTSVELLSPESTSGGVAPEPHSEQGHVTLTEMPEGASRLPLSSTARDMIVADGVPWTVQL